MQAGDARSVWANLPLADAETIFGTGRTFVLVPQPNSESIDCGGMIAELCRAGNPPRVAILTDGTGSPADSGAIAPSALRRLREQEVREALRRLGCVAPNLPVFIRLRETEAPHRGALFEVAVARLRAICADCDTICAPWRIDPRGDHHAAHLMAAAVARQASIRHISYPVWDCALPADAQLTTHFLQGWRLDIAGSVVAKQSAVQAHRSRFGTVIQDGLPPAVLEVARRAYEIYLRP